MIFFIKEISEKFPIEDVELDSIRHFSSKNFDEEAIKTVINILNNLILSIRREGHLRSLERKRQ